MSTRAVGQAAEQRAAAYLEGQGYRILHRNYTCPRGEVDLICEDGPTLVFVEVRMRSKLRLGSPVETITGVKRQRIVLTARYYLVRHQVEDRECRFDIVSLVGDDEPTLIRDAFQT